MLATKTSLNISKEETHLVESVQCVTSHHYWQKPKAVHFDGNQLRQVNALLFVLHIWLNEGDRAQTALSMKMSTEMKIMVIMMVFGAVSDNGGVRNCSKNGKDNKNGGKTE